MTNEAMGAEVSSDTVMPTLEEQLKSIDESNEGFKEAIDFGNRMVNLFQSEEFQVVVNRPYLEEEALRLGGLLSGPDVLKQEQIDNINKDLAAIKSFKIFFKRKYEDAAYAEQSIAANEEYRKEVTAAYAEMYAQENE